MEEDDVLVACYGPGSIAGAIIGTLLITLALAGAGLLVYNLYWRSRKGKHLVLVSDVENPDDHFAFDNPNFREATPIKQQSLVDETKSSGLDLSWLGNWSPLQAFSTPRNEKQSLDDSFVTNSQLKVVSLKSHDFTGLGFSVCGNMRDGIFVKDLLHRGPAFESGRISPGDRIDSICISFRHMVFEDALTILSYASPYEVQIQVEQNGVSRPSTLLRKRETSGSSTKERILHPFYRSQSISDLTSIQKASDQKSTEKKGMKTYDGAANDFPTLKLSPSVNQRKRDDQSLDKKGVDSVDGAELPRHAKFGVRVLPTGGSNSRNLKDHTENEQNIVIEQSLTHKSDDGKDVKALITKGIQNIREKINQNTLGRKKKEEGSENEHIVAEKKVNAPDQCIVVEAPIPLEVERAAASAQNNRKSVSAESLAARRPASEVCIEIIPAAAIGEAAAHKKSKGKAPSPPQAMDEPDVESVKEYCNVQIFGRQQTTDSDSETESGEMTCTQVTVHHSSSPEESEPNRKAASLGDLSRLEVDNYSGAGTLERAASLDLDGPHGKKRKAPMPPPEDFPYEDQFHIKEPRLEGLNTFNRRLKKSSDFGRLEDAWNSTSDDSLSTNDLSTERLTDLNSDATHKINEFSSWLEEVRKPSDALKLNFNFTSDIQSKTSDDVLSKEDQEIPLEDDSDAPKLSSSAILDSNDSGFRETNCSTNEVISILPSPAVNDRQQSYDSIPESIPSLEQSVTKLTAREEYQELNSAQPEIEIVVNGTVGVQVLPSYEPPILKENESSAANQPASFTLSVNGMNLQDSSRTVVLISQPNSLELEGLNAAPPSPDEDTPPRLPMSPPPTNSLSYVTEIQVTAPHDHPVPPPKVKPVRKDITPETSRIPVRTMKSETGQKVLAAIHSLAAKEFQKTGFEVCRDPSSPEESAIPSVAGFYLKKVPPAVPPRRNDSNSPWTEGFGKEPVNGTPRRVPMPSGVSLPVKTSATKIVFESLEKHEEF